MNLKSYQPVDILVLILTVVIAFLIAMVPLTVMIRGEELSDPKSKILEGVVNSITAILSMYVGAKIQEKKDSRKEELK